MGVLARSLAACATAVALLMTSAGATEPVTSDVSVRRFLTQNQIRHGYRASRRLEAQCGDRRGWLDADTDYSREQGFRYRVTGEGGSGFIRDRILKAVLDAEKELAADGDLDRSALSPLNYIFQPRGVDSNGLSVISLLPLRKDHRLVNGTLLLRPEDGAPVRLEGRLSKSPSFWVKDVDLVWSYNRFTSAVMPVAMESNAVIRFLGPASLRVSYLYSEIDGTPITGGIVP